MNTLRLWALVGLILLLATEGKTQDRAVRDLTIPDGAPPVRLVGYGLVTGLSGTGDRVTGTFGARHTVQSVVNLLRNFEVQVPANLLRTRNVAAVLVTAEVSPYLRAGGRFDVHVSSVGDAQSLRGGVLWMTPLVGEVGGPGLAIAQGQLLVTDPSGMRNVARGATSGRVLDGGIVETVLPRPAAVSASRLLLRDPDATMAHRIAAVITAELDGTATATAEDPGAILVSPAASDADIPTLMAQIAELRVRALPLARILVDARDGTIVAGGELPVGNGVVSAEGITLIIGGEPGTSDAEDSPSLPSGATLREVAEALRTVRATARQTTALILALRDAGAVRADVVIR